MTRAMQYKLFNRKINELERKLDKKNILWKSGEAHRPRWVAIQYALQGVGIENSKHVYSLAKDYFLLTDDGLAILPYTHIKWSIFGKMVEDAGLTWGGKFKRKDMVHAEWPEIVSKI